jgi:hypothetical protein
MRVRVLFLTGKARTSYATIAEFIIFTDIPEVYLLVISPFETYGSINTILEDSMAQQY